MDFLFEFMLDLVLDGSIEIIKNNKVPKWIRIILFIFIAVFLAAVIGVMYYFAFYILDKSIIGAVLIFLVATFLFVCIIFKFIKTYISKKIPNNQK